MTNGLVCNFWRHLEGVSTASCVLNLQLSEAMVIKVVLCFLLTRFKIDHCILLAVHLLVECCQSYLLTSVERLLLWFYWPES